MTIEDILHALPSREDIATAVGLQREDSKTGDLLTAVGILGTGMILGAALALLFAPKTGHEMRGDIAEKVSELGEQLRPHGAGPATSANGPSA